MLTSGGTPLFCAQCAALLLADAAYCSKCGGKVFVGSASRGEHCDVTTHWYKVRRTHYLEFVANAVGPGGTFVAGTSARTDMPSLGFDNDQDTVKPPSTASRRGMLLFEAHQRLLAELLRDGWTVTGQGRYWYQARLSR